MTFLRSPLSTLAALTICCCSSFAQQPGAGVILTSVPETGSQLGVIVEGRVSITSIESSAPDRVNPPSVRTSESPDASIVSVTTLQAPPNAIRSYESAQEAFAKTKLDLAERELKKATNVYPRFALAWTMLGTVHEKQARLEQAKADYAQALSADSRMILPVRRLAEIAFENKKWDEVVQLTNTLIRVHSSDVPVAYLYNAAANFNRGDLSAAELSARRFESLDPQHQWPQVYLLLGDILQAKGNYIQAAQQMKTFLTIVPDDSFADPIRKEAERLEQMPRAR